MTSNIENAMSHVIQNWRLEKPVAVSRNGIVISQNGTAARAGAEMLRAGGNAVDAAVTTAFALAAAAPPNSALGGIGYMLVQRPGAAPQVVDFGPVAPKGLDPALYPLTGKMGTDLFAWPQVEGDRNIHGPLSIAVPGSVDGYGLALETFGSRPLAEVMAPAIALAGAGLPADWFASLKILAVTRDLQRYAESRRIWLRNDLPPTQESGLPPPRVVLGALAESLERIAKTGRREIYEGELARLLVKDIAADGGILAAEDLASCRARIVEPTSFAYRGLTVAGAPVLTAGPTFRDVLTGLEQHRFGKTPDAAFFVTMVEALNQAYERRLNQMGDAEPKDACTTHITAVDRDGMVVAMTTTLLSSFGSRYVSPSTGILMNNGIMWFDPRPGRPNSLGPAKRPLTNMCPVIVARDGRPWLASGASGGRRIVGAVAQLMSFVVDFGLDAGAAAHHPRIDASGGAATGFDPRLAPDIVAALRKRFSLAEFEHAAFPGQYANPSLVVRRPSGEWEGVSDVMTPTSAAVAA